MMVIPNLLQKMLNETFSSTPLQHSPYFIDLLLLATSVILILRRWLSNNTDSSGRTPFLTGMDAALDDLAKLTDAFMEMVVQDHFDRSNSGPDVGINFAMTVVEIVLANVLQKFDWELPDGIRANDLDMSESTGGPSHRNDPLKVVAKPYVV